MSSDEKTTPKPRRKVWKIVFIVFLCLWVVNAVNQSLNPDVPSSSANSSSEESIATYDDSWIPNGFTGFTTDDNLAWRWGTKKETNCTYSYGSCWSVVVVTKEGCPSGIYGEIAILDKSDVQIDYTNDTTTLVPAGEKVKMTFDTFNEEAETARLSKLTCR
jgi:hypothetical protein